MNINILTLFPEMFAAVTTSSMLGRAAHKDLLDVRLVNIRDHTVDKHRRVDDSPFGGGAGMVLTPDPVFRAMESLDATGKKIYMSPRGAMLDYAKIKALAREEVLTIFCGHYEGADQRILDYWGMEEISIGDYILTGGEPAAMVLIDAVCRMIPGVLGESRSIDEESIYSGLLEYPQYTKPRNYRGMEVPEVLVNGNHALIRLWQLEESLTLTKNKRPDLLENFCAAQGDGLSKKEAALLKKILFDRRADLV